jgi:hypothetical protein
MAKVKHMDIPLPVIPKPEHASILEHNQDAPFNSFVTGNGSDNYVCGNCGAVLCKNIVREKALGAGKVKLASIAKEGIVLKCPYCDNYNALSQYEGQL